MASLAWPLERNHIRRNITNNAFGMVRNGGSKAHQGWDLYAPPGTPCYAIAEGEVVDAFYNGAYGNSVVLRFTHGGQVLYAMYCHLSVMAVRQGLVKRGDLLGLTGNTGNAASMRGEDQHLHFEMRTTRHSGTGLDGRMNPAKLYGIAPIGWTYYESHQQKKQVLVGLGLKIKGINVREVVQ